MLCRPAIVQQRSQTDAVNRSLPRSVIRHLETNNPFKKMRPDPDDPSKVRYTDPHTGKEGKKAKPPGFDEWWNSRK
jgi:hypothetical protein